MTDLYTAENFTRYINTKFSVKGPLPIPVELELARVEVRKNESTEQAGMERFSAVFYGPAESFLSQQMYELAHPEMGELQIFLVGLGKDERGFRYEAVFNRFKTADG
jgi:hypothetical protein